MFLDVAVNRAVLRQQRSDRGAGRRRVAAERTQDIEANTSLANVRAARGGFADEIRDRRHRRNGQRILDELKLCSSLAVVQVTKPQVNTQ